MQNQRIFQMGIQKKTGVFDKFSKECIEAVGKRIAKYYEDIDGIDDFVTKAVNDIHEYAEALGLYKYLRDLCKNKTGFHSNVEIKRQVTEDDAGIMEITGAMLNDKAKIRKNTIKIFCKHKNSVVYQTSDDRFVNLDQDMSIRSEMTGTEAIWKYIKKDVAATKLQKNYVQSRNPITEILHG